MKNTSVCTLLVCCLCLGAHAEDKKLNDGLSSIQARKLQLGTQGLQTPKRKLTEETNTQCTPAILPLIGAKRIGTEKTVIPDKNVTECIQLCPKDPDCVAINFDVKAKNCTILTSVTEIVPTNDWITVIFKFEYNDPCTGGNIIKGYHQAHGDYKIFPPGEVVTAVNCCSRCVDERDDGCVAWDYQSESQKCFLKKTFRPLKPATRPSLLFTGSACAPSTTPPPVVV